MPYLREMLDISGVTQYIEIYDTVDEASGILLGPVVRKNPARCTASQ